MFEVNHADRIPEPGAKRSKHVPKFENEERASLVVVEPTVIALAARAGDELQALALLLPAATAIGDSRIVQVVNSGVERTRDTTAETHIRNCRVRCDCLTQSTPAITPEFEPEPEQLSTRTPRSNNS